MARSKVSDIAKERETYASRAVPFDFGADEMLGNPALDKMVSCVVAMASEMWATKRRLMVVEALLEQKGLSPEVINSYVGTEEQEQAWEAERDRFIQLALAPLSHDTHQPLSSGDNGFTDF